MAQSSNGIPSTNNVLNSITRQAKYEPFDLQVARGQVTGHSILSIFGYQSAITSTTSIPVWENSAAYVYPTTAATLTVVSTSTSDNTSASILINGLDSNFLPISETLFLNGTTAVTSVKSYLRVNSLFMLSPGSSQTTNVGTITAKQSTNTVAAIAAGIGKSQSTIYTVPAGYTFYLDIVEVNTSNSYTGSVVVTYNVQTTNNNTGVTLSTLQQPFVSNYVINRPSNPFAYAEKTDIQWQLKVSSSSIAAGVIVTGKLISNGN